ncbi:MAG: YkvA family protein [Polyangiales bacterium]
MSSERFLEIFPEWLRTLGGDVTVLGAALADETAPESARRAIAGGLNYVFKSVDLIPDGIDDIGYLDDAFILRVASAQAVAAGLSAEAHGAVAALAADTATVKDFLAAEYSRLERYASGLQKGAARGRSVDDIVTKSGVREELLSDARAFSREYAAPPFTREERTLIKLRAFFDARLPR